MNYTVTNTKTLVELAKEQQVEFPEDIKSIIAEAGDGDINALAKQRGVNVRAFLIEKLSAVNDESDTSASSTGIENTNEPTQKKVVSTIKYAEKEEGQVLAGLYGNQAAISELLSIQKKVPVYIPLMEGEKHTAEKKITQYVGLNGASYHITKGVVVEVPESIAQIVHESQKSFVPPEIESMKL